MNILESSQIAQIERILGRPLSADELKPADRLADISDAAKLAARTLAKSSKVLAVMYLREIVERSSVSEATVYLEKALSSKISPAPTEHPRDGSPAESASPAGNKRLLVRIGFFREMRHGKPTDPSLGAAVRATGDPDETRVVQYLSAGHVFMASPGLVKDALDPKGHVIGSLSVLTDGQYAWPSDLAYYVERYHVRLPDEFVSMISAHEWRVPESVDLKSLRLS